MAEQGNSNDLVIGDISPAFAAALVRMQGSIEGAKKGKSNPAFKSKYADLGACWDACESALQENGIAVLQWPCKADPGHVGLRTMLVYGPTGETLSGEFQLPLKDPTNAQAGGSAITYARRYALCSVIGICPEDDDGNAASATRKDAGHVPQAPTAQQAEESAKLEAGYRARFDGLTDIPSKKSLYSEVKASNLTEPARTKLLGEMADSIKKDMAK